MSAHEQSVLDAPINTTERPKKGTALRLKDGRVVKLAGWAFGKANVQSEGGATFQVPTNEVWIESAAEPKREKTVFEGQVDAILGIIGHANDIASSKFPEYHCVRVSKRGTVPNGPPQFEKYLGWGYIKLSEDPVDSGGADMVLMGVPHEVYAALERAIDEETNGWKKNPYKVEGDFTSFYEESEKKSLDDLSKGFSG